MAAVERAAVCGSLPVRGEARGRVVRRCSAGSRAGPNLERSEASVQRARLDIVCLEDRPRRAFHGCWTTLVDLHQTEDAHDVPSSGCFTLHTNRTEFLLITRSSAQDPLLTRARDEVRWRVPLIRGQWLNSVIRFVVDPHGNGAFQMWCDGMLVADPGPIPLGYVDKRGPYIRYGPYRPVAPETMVVHLANSEITTESLIKRVRVLSPSSTPTRSCPG